MDEARGTMARVVSLVESAKGDVGGIAIRGGILLYIRGSMEQLNGGEVCCGGEPERSPNFLAVCHKYYAARDQRH